MEHDPQQPALGMLGCDREVFARVWGRVAPGSGEGCPIEVLPPTGTAARSLSSMAADERRHAKRLSAAFFLISGVRFLPETQPISRPICGLMGSLRERFWEEQHGAAAYLASAEEAADPCLAALYRELAAEEGAHADLLRAMVERM